jgi:competence protein ComK
LNYYSTNHGKGSVNLEIKDNYLINSKTILLYGVLHENGHVYTFVLEEEEAFLVAMPPVKLIDKSLICYGSNFAGALKSSSALLGKERKKYPIKISESLDIWLFPTKSYRQDNCVWFALNHVKDTQPIGNKFTKVILSNWHMFELMMRETAFRGKLRMAENLRDLITLNTKSPIHFLIEPKKGFMIVEKKGKYNVNEGEI